jgi:hypothetical protein
MSDVSLKRLKLGFWLLAASAGAFQTWVHRYEINPDGISYLDVADAYFRGDWNQAINSYWSPLYSWLLGLVLVIAEPGMRWEYPVAHLVNLIIYLCALGSFSYFLNGLVQRHRAVAKDGGIPEWAFLLTGYLIFFWSTFTLITWDLLTPDIIVAAIVYAVCGLLVRIRSGVLSSRYFALLGVLLGLGYLAKTVMLLAAFVFLVISLLLVRGHRAVLPRAILAYGCFLLLAVPFIIVLSQSKGRLTFGDSGKLNYAWIVNREKLRHWHGDAAAHASRKVFDSPAIYEFGEPFAATYPIWYDPSYWYEGIDVRFNLKDQMRAVAVNFVNFARMFSDHGLLLVTGFIALLTVGKQLRRLIEGIIEHWWLLVPSLSLMAIYSLVHAESRHVAPFAATILLAMISSLSLPNYLTRRRLTLVGVILIPVLSIGPSTIHAMTMVKAVGERHLDVAKEVRKLGITPGEKIASLNYSNTFNSKWARLARLRIVSEIYDKKGTKIHDDRDVELYWQGDRETKLKVMEAFRRTGATLVVAEELPPGISISAAAAAGWQPIGQTGVYAYFLCDLPTN